MRRRAVYCGHMLMWCERCARRDLRVDVAGHMQWRTWRGTARLDGAWLYCTCVNRSRAHLHTTSRDMNHLSTALHLHHAPPSHSSSTRGTTRRAKAMPAIASRESKASRPHVHCGRTRAPRKAPEATRAWRMVRQPRSGHQYVGELLDHGSSASCLPPTFSQYQSFFVQFAAWQ